MDEDAMAIIKHMDAIKVEVYNNNPAALAQLEAIWEAAKNLDRYNAHNPNILPVERDIVTALWVAHGSPEVGTDWPTPPEGSTDPMEAREADAAPRQGRAKHK